MRDIAFRSATALLAALEKKEVGSEELLKHFLSRRGHLPGDVATRAAQRVGEREGRAVRVPKPPPIAGSGGAPGRHTTGGEKFRQAGLAKKKSRTGKIQAAFDWRITQISQQP